MDRSPDPAAVELYVLVTTSLCRLPVLDTVRLALEGGARAIQLREKGMADGEFVALARRIAPVVREAGGLFVLNDRLEAAAVVDCDGVHLGQEDAPLARARALLGPEALIGISTHDLAEARAAAAAGADYLGFGPVFPTGTKRTGYPPRGAAAAAAAASAVGIPVFAIGGVGPDRLGELRAAGVRRVAVSSAICGAMDPRAVARRILEGLRPPGGETPRRT